MPLDLSGLDRRLKDVRLRKRGVWWDAEVKIGERTFVGTDDFTGGAVANLVSSDLLWEALGERLVREG